MSGDYNTHNDQQPNINYTDHTVDLSKYALFVDGVTSDPSKDYQSFVESLDDLDAVSYTHLTLPTNREV